MARLWLPIFVGVAVLLAGCDRAELIEQRLGARVPGPPDPATEGATEPERVFVLRDILLRQGQGLWRTLGWNLDERCTEPPDTDAGMPDGGVDPLAGWDIECIPLNVGDLPPEDGDECRDNNYGQFISLGLEPLGINVQDEARDKQAQGELAFLLRLRDYNGTPNDPQVRVEVAQTVIGVPEGGVEGDPLLWDGTDVFYPAENAFNASGEPILADPVGYVRDGLLVMRIPPRSDFRFDGGDRSFQLRITDGTITARVEGDRLEDVVVAGRWAIADFLDDLDALGVCEGDMLRGVIEAAIRGSADVLSNPDSVPGGLVPCDALSLAIGFTGYPGVWSDETRPAPGLPPICM